MVRTWCVRLIVALIVAGACTGTVQARQNSADGGIKHDGKAVGKDIGHGARTVGHETRRLAIKVGHGARDAGKGIGHGARDGWNATRKAVKGIFEHD